LFKNNFFLLCLESSKMIFFLIKNSKLRKWFKKLSNLYFNEFILVIGPTREQSLKFIKQERYKLHENKIFYNKIFLFNWILKATNNKKKRG